jgi:hypothetical protein
MDQQQVDVIEPELAQRVLGRLLDRGGGQIPAPDFGGDEYLLARQAGFGQSRADLGLVLIALRGIEMAIPDIQRHPNQARSLGAAQPQCAEA